MQKESQQEHDRNQTAAILESPAWEDANHALAEMRELVAELES